MKSSRLTAYVVKYDDLWAPARDLMNEMGELHSELHHEICHPDTIARAAFPTARTTTSTSCYLPMSGSRRQLYGRVCAQVES